ncbi:MAG: hypothetical protein ABI696_06225 [Rubrivivax sp.]
MTDSQTPFPSLPEILSFSWHWPVVPFAWRHRRVPDIGDVQPCTLEAGNGGVAVGELMGFDPTARSVHFRRNGGREVHEVPHTRLRRLILGTPLEAPTLIDADRIEQVPATAHEREYGVKVAATGETLVCRSSGHVENELGLFLWLPTGKPESLERVFVPRHFYTRFEHGPSVSEIALEVWITEPKALLQAIADQEHKPVRPIGEALLALGMLTRPQIDATLARQTGEKPLGEMLVEAGLLSRADLRTAIAYKLGCPLVDLDRFPIDPEAMERMPERLAIKFRAVPLMVDGKRLILAVDSPARITELQKLRAYQEIDYVAVLAPKLQILRKLDQLQADDWSENVAKPLESSFRSTTN